MVKFTSTRHGMLSQIEESSKMMGSLGGKVQIGVFFLSDGSPTAAQLTSFTHVAKSVKLCSIGV